MSANWERHKSVLDVLVNYLFDTYSNYPMSQTHRPIRTICSIGPTRPPIRTIRTTNFFLKKYFSGEPVFKANFLENSKRIIFLFLIWVFKGSGGVRILFHCTDPLIIGRCCRHWFSDWVGDSWSAVYRYVSIDSSNATGLWEMFFFSR